MFSEGDSVTAKENESSGGSKKQVDEKTYLKLRNDELNKELVSKMNTIHQLEEHVKSLEVIIGNYKKNLNDVNKKVAQGDNLKVDMGILKNKIVDLESELNYHKVENMRLSEIIHSKDNLISQFQNLVGISTNKFKLFEETNQSLRDENIHLKNKLDELGLKFNTSMQKENIISHNIDELKNTLVKTEQELERVNNELNKKDEDQKKRTEEIEALFKNKMKNREEELKAELLKEIVKTNGDIEKHLLENEQLRLENKTLLNKIEDFESVIMDKELEFKRAMDEKDREYEKLFRSLKELQRDIKEVEFNYKEKIEDLKRKNKNLDEGGNTVRKDLISKDKQISSLQKENAELIKALEELNDYIQEYEITLDNKENVIKTLRNENSEILKGVNKNKLECEEYENKFVLELEALNNKLKLLEREKEMLFKEKDEDHKEIIELRTKLNDLQGSHTSKLISMDKDKEVSVEKHSKELLNSFNSKEDQYLAEISRLQNLIMERDHERENMKLKYEKKIHSVRFLYFILRLNNYSLG